MDERDNASRIGAAVVGGGVLLVLLSLIVLPWYRVSGDFFAPFFAGTGSTASFSEVHPALDRFHQSVVDQGIPTQYVSFGVAGSYFGWLGWVLALAAAVGGGLAVSPVGDRRWSPRWLAAVIAFAGGGITVTALDLVSFAGNPPPNARPPSFSEFMQQTSFGPWVAVAGYTLVLAGAFAPHTATTDATGSSVRFAGVRRK